MIDHPKNNFNFLRLFLALLVLLSHSPELIDGDARREIIMRIFHTNSFGGMAVAGFFILSGYLIVGSWERNPSAIMFLEKRIRRIFPGFVVAVFLSIVIFAPLGADSPSKYFDDLDWQSNIWRTALLQLPEIPPVFVGTFHQIVNGAIWTIPWEFACYLGAMFLGLAGAVRTRSAWLAVAATLLASCFLHRCGLLPEYAVLDRLNLLSCFAVGGCFYLYREKVSLTSLGAMIASLALIVGLCFWKTSEIATMIAGGYLLFYIAFKKISLIANFDNLPDVSYGAYLYGWPIQKLLLWYIPSISPWALFPLSAVLAICAGGLSWHLVESSFLKRDPKHLRVRDISPATSGSA